MNALVLLAFVVRPLVAPPDLRAVADRTQAFTVFVTARSAEGEATASGVLLRGGLVLTDLHGLVARGDDGGVVPAEISVFVEGAGRMPAQLAGGDTRLGIAVLRLPDEAKGLPGATIATEDPAVADQLLAMGNDGKTVDVLGVKVDHVGRLLRTTASLPPTFRGGPLFDASGNLAALQLPQGAAAASAMLRILQHD